jgi:chemotaxis protein MotB
MSHPLRSKRASARQAASPYPGSLSLEKAQSAHWQGDDTGWLITMSDLTLLLISFLVLWYFVASKKGTAEVPQAASRLSPRVETPNGTRAGLEWASLKSEMEDYVRELRLENEVRIESFTNQMIVSLKDTVPFATGKAELREKALPVLERVVAMVLGRSQIAIEVTGHADSRPISTHEYPSNWELSTARASRVARYLVERGIHPSRIAVQGYGNHRPLVPDSTERNRSVNRRVEVRLYQRPDRGDSAM